MLTTRPPKPSFEYRFENLVFHSSHWHFSLSVPVLVVTRWCARLMFIPLGPAMEPNTLSRENVAGNEVSVVLLSEIRLPW